MIGKKLEGTVVIFDEFNEITYPVDFSKCKYRYDAHFKKSADYNWLYAGSSNSKNFSKLKKIIKNSKNDSQYRIIDVKTGLIIEEK